MRPKEKVFITGDKEMVPDALWRAFGKGGMDVSLRGYAGADFSDRGALLDLFRRERPGYIFLTSAVSGGIQANISHPAEFLYQNLEMQNSVIEAARLAKVRRLFFIAASCVYPRKCRQPIREEYLMTGPLEPTNEAYAIAKLAGIKMCGAYNRQYGTDFISLIPSNLYGPGDKFDAGSSHVIPALIMKMYEAKRRKDKSVAVWGSGRPERDFLYIDDFADACLFIMDKDGLPEVMNVASGLGVTVRRLAGLLKKATGFRGKLEFDTTKPDGMPKKVLDITKLRSAGWVRRTEIGAGLKKTCLDYGRRSG
ncbi:MAG: GDP-L-fucose synthase [Candidatus Omnitrophota bacterium]